MSRLVALIEEKYGMVKAHAEHVVYGLYIPNLYYIPLVSRKNTPNADLCLD